MQKQTILLLSLLVPTTFVLAQTATERTPSRSSRTDGEYWRSLDRKERWQLAHGVLLGLLIAHSYGDLTTETASKLYLKMSLDDAVIAFDRFYGEPKNRPIPVEAAWMVEVARGAGVAPVAVQKLIEDLRATSTGKAAHQLDTQPPTKHPEVYDIALNHADRSKKLKGLFGEDIVFENERANAWALGPDEGEAYVFFDVSGGNHTGRLNGHAKRVSGKWVYDHLQVLVIGTGDIVNLLTDTVE
jgi:hypothetical protein